MTVPSPASSSNTGRRTLYSTPLVHSLSLTELEVLPRALVCVDPLGIIEWVENDCPGESVQAVALRHGIVLGDESAGPGGSSGGVEVVEVPEGEFIAPGLIDTHTHAPQYANIGTGHQFQLIEWLHKLTFPQEARCADLEYARPLYHEVVKRNLNFGSTTVCYYASVHAESAAALADICHERGQRAFVGKACVDRSCPDYYCESTTKSNESTAALVSHFDAYPSEPSRLVQPIVTPRFAITSSPESLRFLGELARSRTPSLAIQTHMSENKDEIAQTKRLFPDCETYPEVYESYGLLGEGTILAHCVHLDDRDREVLRRTGAGVSHCPSSNLNLNSGAADVKALFKAGIKVGLGTDCSGGPSMGILSAVRSASDVSRFLAFGQPDRKSLSIPELFHMATLGGASLCRLDGTIGNFLPGKEFDALRVRPASPGMWTTKEDDTRRLFEKWVLCGDDRDLADVWVRGRRVGGSSSRALQTANGGLPP